MADEYQNDFMDEEEEFKTPKNPEKKRKTKKKKIERETENHGEDETLDIRVSEISERPDRIPPIVAYFASGYDPCAPSDGGESPKVTVYRHKAESRKRLQVVVSPPGSNVEFVGTNYTGEQAARQTCVYKLGVLNKESQTLRIVPIAHNKVFRLEPRVKLKGTVDSGVSENADNAELSEAQKRMASLDTLNLHFGTKTAITQEKKRRARNLGADSEANKSLEGKLGKVDVNVSALESTSAIVARNIPPYDASATTPREAYPIEGIIEKGEWAFLQDIYRLLQQGTQAATEAYPVFVRNRLYKLRDIKDETEKQTAAGVLTFLTHLIKFKDMNSMNFDSAKNHKFPPMIRQKCRRLFKDSDAERMMPSDKIHLLISYVLVLALHVDNFKTDPEDIAKDLRMSKVDLRKHFDNLGCKFSVEKTISFATLPVPLKFTQITRRRRR